MQNTPTGCGNDLPTRQAPFSEFSKITQNREVYTFFRNARIYYFINRGGLLTAGGSYLDGFSGDFVLNIDSIFFEVCHPLINCAPNCPRIGLWNC